jgi:hypothetical protein
LSDVSRRAIAAPALGLSAVRAACQPDRPADPRCRRRAPGMRCPADARRRRPHYLPRARDRTRPERGPSLAAALLPRSACASNVPPPPSSGQPDSRYPRARGSRCRRWRPDADRPRQRA